MVCRKAFVVMQTALTFGALFWTQQICTKFIPLNRGSMDKVYPFELNGVLNPDGSIDVLISWV
jgi:hypothetical protein